MTRIECPPPTTALWNGFKGRCPNCGKGKLFKSFLKPVERCDQCGESLGQIRADDGPAWATILATGPIAILMVGLVFMKNGLPDWLTITLAVAGPPLFSLGLLPRMKGLFVALVWKADHASSRD